MSPHKKEHPEFDAGLREDMRTETNLFLWAVIREDRSVLDLLDGRFTFLNERLARHYGMEGIKGNEFRRVSLDGKERSGVLTQASVLTVTSNPTQTSPVKRGKWILEEILDEHPGPPPPDAGQLKEPAPGEPRASFRADLERHRADARCAVCHLRMDGLGFALENYDLLGAWRDRDGEHPVDATGHLPGGRVVEGPRGLKAMLLADPEPFRRALARKLLTYAIGRGLEDSDRCAVRRITGQLRAGGDRFSVLVLAVVRSDPFLLQRTSEPGPSAAPDPPSVR